MRFERKSEKGGGESEIKFPEMRRVGCLVCMVRCVLRVRERACGGQDETPRRHDLVRKRGRTRFSIWGW